MKVQLQLLQMPLRSSFCNLMKYLFGRRRVWIELLQFSLYYGECVLKYKALLCAIDMNENNRNAFIEN